MTLQTDSVSVEAQDLTRDGSLLKTILVEGEGEEARRGARVAVRYALRLSDEEDTEPFDSSAKRRNGLLEFTLGRKKVIPALELVAQSMKQGEKCTARAAAPYAFGSRGLKRKGVPPGVPIYLDVEMVRFEGGEKRKPMADMTPAERFQKAKESKETGNSFFKEQKYEKALGQYSQAIHYLSNIFYKPSSTLADPAAKLATADNAVTPDEKGNEKLVQMNGKPTEEGFEEAEVVDVSQGDNAEATDATVVSPGHHAEGGTDTTAEGATVVDTRVVRNDGERNETDEEGLNAAKEQLSSSGKGGSGEDGDIVETIDATGSSSLQKTSGSEQTEDGVEDAPADAPEKTSAEDQDNKTSTSPEAAEPVAESDGPGEEEVRALHVTTLNNLSLCFVKQEDYKRAKESAGLALKIDPASSKAFYYRYVTYILTP